MSTKNVIIDIWDYAAYKTAKKFPADELNPEQIRRSVGMERKVSTGETYYFIPR